MFLSIFLSNSIDQKPCIKSRNDVTNTNGTDTIACYLMDKIASNNRNDVIKVRTKPTPRAALKRAIVLEEETVYIFIVEKSTYIPTVKKIIIGILV
jgi:hypothetical protein